MMKYVMTDVQEKSRQALPTGHQVSSFTQWPGPLMYCKNSASIYQWSLKVLQQKKKSCFPFAHDIKS